MGASCWRGKPEASREEIKRLQDINGASRSAVELDQTSVGRVSRIDAMQAQQLALAAERQRQDDLIRIEAALARIVDRTFGDCLICGEEIAHKRLEFDPPIALTRARAAIDAEP